MSSKTLIIISQTGIVLFPTGITSQSTTGAPNMHDFSCGPKPEEDNSRAVLQSYLCLASQCLSWHFLLQYFTAAHPLQSLSFPPDWPQLLQTGKHDKDEPLRTLDKCGMFSREMEADGPKAPHIDEIFLE
eukprot:TRINITY_DN77020_c0_g1_i1.p2 TRINITY_DN77020_c0_g1~~TRINITY_DN77020_c0_g1_i1.p2  ORF type:complete len:130 (-),score=15.93 TRINITY_DN77020_c0_g1_i1:70-459(-)